MKKIVLSILAAVFSLTLLSACNGAGNSNTTYTVTFVQDGQTNIVKQVKSGEALRDIPLPQEVAGYDVTWDKASFDSVSSNLTVTAVLTPKTYVIEYTVHPYFENNGYEVVLEKQSQEVRYNATFELASASCEGLVFLGWWNEDEGDFIHSGTYTWTDGLTLVARFEPEDQEWS